MAKKKARKKTKKIASKKIKKVSKKKTLKKKPLRKTKRTKRPAKKAARKLAGKAKKSSKKRAMSPELIGMKEIGEITHYFPHVKAGVVDIKRGTLKAGDAIYIKGHTTDFKQTVTSIQIDRQPIQEAKPGDDIGLLVKSRVRIGDKVYKA